MLIKISFGKRENQNPYRSIAGGATENSHLEELGHYLMDVVGPQACGHPADAARSRLGR
jgi:hypothetical protein